MAIGKTPKVYNVTVPADSTWDDTETDFLTDLGTRSVFTRIKNVGDIAVSIRLNGRSDAVIALDAGEVETFRNRDLELSKLEFENEDLVEAGYLEILAAK